MREVQMGWLSQRFELSHSGSGTDLLSMEGLRGFAVFLVFLVHYTTLIDPWTAKQPALHAFADDIHTIGNAGVDLFFVLSGYLIYGSLMARPQPFLRYMRRRVERIYPTFSFVFVVYVLLALALPATNKIPVPATAAAIYLLENFLLLPGLFPIEPLITVAWSLSYEVLFYLTIPLLILVLGLRERSAGWRVSLFAAFALAIALACSFWGGPLRLVMFISGILLHEAIRRKRLSLPPGWVVVTALAGALLFQTMSLHGPGAYALKILALFVAFFLVCLSCFGAPTGLVPRVFSWRPLRWLGNMSYSYYLIHGLALKTAFVLVVILWPPSSTSSSVFWLLLPVTFALTLVPAGLLFLTIERPLSLSTHPRTRAEAVVSAIAPHGSH
jgi:exopolysaccharide production protein ExoZ